MHLRTNPVQWSVTGEWLLKNWKLTTRLKNKTWSNPQIKNQEKSLELRLIRPQTKHKNPEHMYLKFLTPLKPSVEKTVNLHGFKQVYKPRIVNVLFSQCGSQQHGSTSHQKCLWRVLRSAVRPMERMGLMMIGCGMAVKRMGMLRVSAKKMETVWLVRAERI